MSTLIAVLSFLLCGVVIHGYFHDTTVNLELQEFCSSGCCEFIGNSHVGLSLWPCCNLHKYILACV